jgi:type I restriction enzyme S subunit
VTLTDWKGDGPFHQSKFAVTSLGAAAEVTLGKMIESSKSGEQRKVPYIKAANVRDDRVAVGALGTMWASEADIRRLDVKVKDIFVIEGGATAGRASQVQEEPPTEAIFQNSVHRIRPRNGSDQRFLLYVLSCFPTSGWYEAICSTATFKHLTSEKMKALRIPLPSFDEQRTIADFLDRETARIDALIAKKRHLSRLLDERFRSQLDQIFDSLAGDLVPLGRFMLSITQGVSPQAEGRPALEHEWGLLKLSAVKFGRYVPSENKALPQRYSIDSKLVPAEGDLLVTRSNTPNYVGDACAVRVTAPRVLLCDLIYRVRIDQRILPNFAAYALLTCRARHHLGGSGRGTSQSMVKLRGEDIRAARIPYVSALEQSAVVSSIDRIRQQTDRAMSRLSLHLGLLQEGRQALITAAVTGQMDIPSAA